MLPSQQAAGYSLRSSNKYSNSRARGGKRRPGGKKGKRGREEGGRTKEKRGREREGRERRSNGEREGRIEIKHIKGERRKNWAVETAHERL